MPKRSPRHSTTSRKKEHVDIVLSKDVGFRSKTTGLEGVEFIHNALPELNFDEIHTDTTFLGRSIGMPLIISSMTGGYADAFRINRALAEVCEELRIPLGVGSQRQALEDTRFHHTFSIVREVAPSIPVMGNIGAAEVAAVGTTGRFQHLCELIRADGFIVHLNPLQELLQPEGTPRFKGVLKGIERLVRELPVPVIVKEIGAGLSPGVVRRLLDVGVRTIDIAGAGGTSWAGVEILRRKDRDADTWWDWGIPTADALRAVVPLKAERGAFTLIASGGIGSGRDVAAAIGLGADLVGAARPMLQALRTGGTRALKKLIAQWGHDLRSVMFLTGSASVPALQTAPLRTRVPV